MTFPAVIRPSRAPRPRNQMGEWAYVRYLRNRDIPLSLTLRVMFGINERPSRESLEAYLQANDIPYSSIRQYLVIHERYTPILWSLP